ncbi:hypothetical protein [Ferruginibacter sp.]|nr:hypothetical protein [Ferruginibacter sp.]
MNNTNLKVDEMPQPKLKQAVFETGALKRSLVFIREENMHLKNRVSEILQNGFDKKMLNKMEIFQNRFIMEDELVSLLRNDVAEIDRLLINEGKAIAEINKKLRKLSCNIEVAESHFGKLKLEFNNFLSENI